MARKAWEDLAASTRARYARVAKKYGISNVKAAYTANRIPSTFVYGKRPSPIRTPTAGLTPRQTASMVRQAQRAGIKSGDVDDILERAVDAGVSYNYLHTILQEREMIRRLPNAERKRVGREWWDRRAAHLPEELFWY